MEKDGSDNSSERDRSSEVNGDEPSVEPGVFNPELTRQELMRGQHAGDQYLRVERPYAHLFRRVSPGTLRATEQVSEPRTMPHRIWTAIKHLVIGYPLATEREIHERLTKVKALAVFGSDAISSTAYATEEILLILVLAGSAALVYSLPISFLIAFLLAIVAFSYRQTIYAYPSGGGSYIVAKDNLGEMPGLIAAASLMVDYVLTVAVSIAAGSHAITSAFPELHDLEPCLGSFCLNVNVLLSLLFVVIITLGNLRGIRESGSIFMVPTYAFLISLLTVLVVGAMRVLMGWGPAEQVAAGTIAPEEPISLWLLLTAFSAGAVAMTGTEAISNGVPAFMRPESKNAARTLTVMAAFLAIFFISISLLAWLFGIVPSPTETVISQLGRAAFGRQLPYLNLLYFFLQFATMGVLVIAANTAFADFPRLSSILARDDYMPHQFQMRGDRLAFSTGIVALGLIAGVLIVIFQGETHLLIPLYAVGVFIAFTLSQTGMIQHWRKLREPDWLKHAAINGVGAVATAIILTIAAITKFERGAWMIIVAIPLIVFTFVRINRHYRWVDAVLDLKTAPSLPANFKLITLVVIPTLNYATERAITFARSISKNVTAVNIAYDPAQAEKLREQLHRHDPELNLVVLESPYRIFYQPLLRYVEALREREPDAMITIVIPEFTVRHFWERWLHNRAARRMTDLFREYPNVTIVNVPYQIGDKR